MSESEFTATDALKTSVDGLASVSTMIRMEKNDLHNPPFAGSVFMADHLADTQIDPKSRYSQEQIERFNTQWAKELETLGGDYSKLHEQLSQRVRNQDRAVQAIATLSRLVKAVSNPRNATANNISEALGKLSLKRRLVGADDAPLDFKEELGLAKKLIESSPRFDRFGKAEAAKTIDGVIAAIDSYGADFTQSLLSKAEEVRQTAKATRSAGS